MRRGEVLDVFLLPLPPLRPLLDGDGSRYELVEPLRWVEPDGTRGEVRLPYSTDLASVPRPVRAIAPVSGRHSAAAIRHDRRCDDLAAWHAAGRPDDAPPHLGSRDADREFRAGVRELDPSRPVRAWAMWAGVRWGALANPARRDGLLPDLPLVLLVSLLIAPVYLPLGLVTGVALLVDRVVEALVLLVLVIARRPAPARRLT